MKQFNNRRPLVSVIMPVYNAGDYLVEAIESILLQTYKNFEFIIVDDGSTDNSWKIIKRYNKKYSKLIRSYKLKKNINAAGNGAVNAVLPYAKGEFIARMDADDIAHPERLEKQVNFLLENTDVILVGTQARTIDSKGKIIGVKKNPLTHEEIYRRYAIVHPIIHPSCMIRRSMLPDRNKLYEMLFGVNDDYYTFFKLHQYGHFANLDEYLLDYRIHSGNSSLNNLKEKYANISRIRNAATIKFGYKISFQAKFTIFIQDILVEVLPEKLLKSIFFMIRGIKTSDDFVQIFNKKYNYVFAKIQNYALSLL